MILDDIGNTTKYNLHSHTQFCDGRAPMEDFAREAVARGFSHYGFSPHSPVTIKSPCNMSAERVDEYLAEVDRLQKIYEGQIRFYKSMEIDYLDSEWGPSSAYFQSLPLDYRIGSVHFVPDDNGFVDIDGQFKSFSEKMSRHFNNDIRHVVTLFYHRSIAMVEAGGFDIIGHFDKIGHNAGLFSPGIEDNDWYRRLVNDLIDAIISKNIIVELNTKAWADHKRMFPDTKWLERLSRAGVPVVVNSDAHYPALIDASRAEGFEMLREAGFHVPTSQTSQI